MLALLLAVATPGTAADAERAFAADARRLGSAAAYRKWAADAATLLVPTPVLARAWLADQAYPPRLVSWAPTVSYLACDGKLAVSTSDWHAADGGTGYLTTVWARRPDGGWRWAFLHGDKRSTPRARPGPGAAKPVVRRASCAGRPDRRRPAFDSYRVAGQPGGGPIIHNRTLRYTWHVEGGHSNVQVVLWNGERWTRVVDDHVTVPLLPAIS